MPNTTRRTFTRSRTRLSPRELAAANTGGWLDERLPEDRLRAMLNSCPGHTFHADPIIETIKSAAGWYRLMRNYEPNELSVSEACAQAAMTVEIVESLRERLLHMEPSLEALTDSLLFKVDHQSVFSVRNRIETDLVMLSLAINKAMQQMKAWPKISGRKRNTERNKALHKTIEAVRKHSTPPMGLDSGRKLARDLLIACRVHVPQDNRELQRLTSPKKRVRRGK